MNTYRKTYAYLLRAELHALAEHMHAVNKALLALETGDSDAVDTTNENIGETQSALDHRLTASNAYWDENLIAIMLND